MALEDDATVVGAGNSTRYGERNIPAGLTNVLGLSAWEYHNLALVGDSAPVVSTPPASITNLAGDTVTFRLTASGTPPLSYQWQFNGTNLLGATNAFLTLSNVPALLAGNYACLVSNALGVTVSSNALLSVTRPPLQFDSSSGGLQPNENGLQLTLTGLSGHGPVILYGSTNLVDWEPIFTNPPSLGTLPFVDPVATNSALRFYRAVEQ